MAYPLVLEMDMPLPGLSEKGFDYEHRFDAPDADYVWGKQGGETTIWRDPKRHTVMLKPAPFTSAWQTDPSGIWARPALAHYVKDDGSTPTDWEEYDYLTTGDTWLIAKTTNERITLKSFLPDQEGGKFAANQGFFLRMNPFGAFGSRGEYFSFEWGMDTVAGTNQYKITVSLDGHFSLYKLGDEVMEGYLAPAAVDRYTVPQRHLEMMILPFRRNEILIWTNQGAYNVHTDLSYLKNDAASVATDPHPLNPNGAAYGSQYRGRYIVTRPGFAAITFPTVKANFQLTPLTYYTWSGGGGVIYNLLPGFRMSYKPDSANWDPGDAITSSFDYDSWRDIDEPATAQFTPGIQTDGSSDRMRWTLLLVADVPDTNHPTQALHSPFVYGFSVQVPPGATTGPDDRSTAYTAYVKSLTRKFSEDSAEAEIEFKDPASIDPGLLTGLNRYCRIYQLDGLGNQNELFIGQATEPEYDEGPASPGGVNHTPVRMVIHDPWWRWDRMLLYNIRALDGMTLDAAVRAILKRVGWPTARQDLDTTTVTIPASPKSEEKLVLSDQVSSAGDLLRMIRDEYSTAEEPPYRWVMDFAPVLDSGRYVMKFRFKNPELFSDVTPPASIRQLYSTQASAIAAGKTSDDWVRTFQRQLKEPEANMVIVAGESPDHEPILVVDSVPESLNPDQGARSLTGLGVTNGSTALTGSGFTVNDVGSTVTIPGAGSGGGDLRTQIVKVTDANNATMLDSASATLGGVGGTLSQPANWIGEMREYFYYNPAINTFAEARRVAKKLLRRLCRPRYLAEWTAAASYDDRLFDRHKMVHDSNRRYSVTEITTEHIVENASLVLRNSSYRGESRDY